LPAIIDLRESSDVSDAEKDKLRRKKYSLNLQHLLKKPQQLQNKLISMAMRQTI